ncbi:MAG: leucyl/phenylalanyl-tRNA--protein transferase [Pseudomonadota bacterium]|jgi:leucyl/phenylalanyl-tRNA--protein transferase|nr:leucyl/phenylalanyl-tRNA--protein transferase [Pseudomonadota bacterium]GIT23760.1 MAG: leucyl/phenylalanyl-tRNA--protein transferase [Gammaproteobacteria bacterium]
MPLPWLEPEDIGFPPIELALVEPNGLLAIGGSLDPEWLLCAYSQGIFPWYEDGQPILWWSPDPRLILTPGLLKVSRSLKRLIKKQSYEITFDTAFRDVIRNCAESRSEGAGTWITDQMQAAYSVLHDKGYAHSVEVWASGELVGGLYGVALGKVFFGESMFSKEDNTSKLALVYLIRQISSWGFELIDCQVSSDHLLTLGAIEISRSEFLQGLNKLVQFEDKIGNWSLDVNVAAHDN